MVTGICEPLLLPISSESGLLDKPTVNLQSQRDLTIQSLARQVSESFAKLEQDTWLDPDLKRQFEYEKPETVSWLRSHIGFLLQVFVFCLFEGIDVGKAASTQQLLNFAPPVLPRAPGRHDRDTWAP